MGGKKTESQNVIILQKHHDALMHGFATSIHAVQKHTKTHRECLQSENAAPALASDA